MKCEKSDLEFIHAARRGSVRLPLLARLADLGAPLSSKPGRDVPIQG